MPVVISSVTPGWGFRGTKGTPLTVAGTGFGTPQGASTITIGAVAAIVVSWADTSIVCRAALATPLGDQDVVVTVGEESDTGTVEVVQEHRVGTVHDGTTRPLVQDDGAGGHAMMEAPQPAEWTVSETGEDTTVTATKDAVTGKRHILKYVDVGFSGPGAAASATAEVRSGSTVLLQTHLRAVPDGAADRWQPDLGEGLACAEGEAVSVVSVAGDGILDVNIGGFTR